MAGPFIGLPRGPFAPSQEPAFQAPVPNPLIPAVVQTTAPIVSAASVASLATNSFPNGVTKGNTIIVLVPHTQASGQTISGVTDTLGNTYVRLGALDATNARPQRLALYMARVTAGGGPNQIVVTTSASTSYSVLGIEVSGLYPTTSPDVYAITATATNVSAWSATLPAPSDPNAFVLAVLVGSNLNSPIGMCGLAPATGWAQLPSQINGLTGPMFATAYRTAPGAASTVNWTWTGGAANNLSHLMVAFRSASGAGQVANVKAPPPFPGPGSRPQLRLVYSAGDTITTQPGTGYVIEGADTAAGTGTGTDNGSAAIVEPSDAVSATGTGTDNGSAALTEGSDSTTATGTGSDNGQAAMVEAADASTAAGTGSDNGQAGITESADAVAASGSSSIAGQGSVVENADGVVGAATGSDNGQAAIAESADTANSSGTGSDNGQAAIVESADAVAATGAVLPIPYGIAALTESADRAAGLSAASPPLPLDAVEAPVQSWSVAPPPFYQSAVAAPAASWTVEGSMQQFGVKPASERRPLQFLFANQLPPGCVMVGPPLVTVTCQTGNDTDPGLILAGAAYIDPTGTIVILPVRGGYPNFQYIIEVNCATNLANFAPTVAGVLSIGYP